MQKTIITLSIILIGSIVANTSHAWTQAGKFRDWGVAVNDKNCAAWTLSKKSNTKTEMIVLFAKGQNTADVHFKIPNLLSKYQLKKAKLEVLGAEYDYQLNITEQSIASSTPANKKSIISAFRKGSDVKSNWSINDGKNRSSSFSLMGFTAAFLKAAEKCGAEKFALTTAPGNQAKSKKVTSNNNPNPLLFIQDVLSELNSSQKTNIANQLKTHTQFNASIYTNYNLKIYAKRTQNLMNSLKEYSQKFMSPEDGFHSINSKDRAKRFLMSILEESERLNSAKQEKLELEKKAENTIVVVNIKKLKAIGNCKKCDLTGADLSKMYLRYSDLTQTNLTGANLSFADLEGVNLSGANLSGAKLYKAMLLKANLRGVYAPNSDLSNTNLSNTNLNNADLAGANLSNAASRHTDMKNVNLRGANMHSAMLMGANLKNANLSDANLRYAVLYGPYENRPNLSGANLSNADLSGADLRESYLKDADLSGAKLRGANLSFSNLEDADLSDADLTGANLQNVNINASKLCRTITPWGEDNSGC